MRVIVCDVAPRDGLQNQKTILEPAVRAELVNRLARAGVPRIETVSFVNPARVPTMAGAEDVCAGIDRVEGCVYAGLVLNEKGYDRLRETTLDEVHYAFASTEEFNSRNSNMTVEDAVQQGLRVVERAREDDRRVTITFGVSFGCPFAGFVDPAHILRLAERFVAADVDEVVFADTVGVAVPRQVRHLVREGVKLGKPVGVHLHNTRNTGFTNALAAVEAGASVVDASVAGIGGCPFAPRATGNICTEDLVYMLNGEGIETGIDVEAMIGIAAWLEGVLGRELEGQLYKAGNFVALAA